MRRAAELLAALAVAALLTGAAAAQDVLSFGKTVARTEPVDGSLVSVGGDVTVSSLVARDLVVVGGDALLSPGARVNGNVLVLGGRLRRAPGSPAPVVAGETHTVEALEAAFLSELETSPAAGSSPAGLLLSLRLALLAGWLVIGSLLLFAVPRRVGAAAASLPESAPLDALLGGLVVLSGALLCAFLFAVLPARAALLLTGATVALLLLAKAFGLAVLCLAIGRRLASGTRRGAAFWGDPAALALGLALLGALSLVPVAGRVLWMAASLVAIGLAAGSALGRRAQPDLTLSARRA